MQSRKEMEKELQTMKEQIKSIDSKKTEEIRALVEEKINAEGTGANLITLLKLIMDENKKTTLILNNISSNLERLEENLNAEYYEQEDQEKNTYLQETNKLGKVQPISGLDAKIMQLIQTKEMACADDIKKQMGYNGRNAASARLNRLYRLGLLERYQLGHKVYYKYDAGKTANTLIVSPPK